jgi:hypothetical protein
VRQASLRSELIGSNSQGLSATVSQDVVAAGAPMHDFVTIECDPSTIDQRIEAGVRSGDGQRLPELDLGFTHQCVAVLAA